jgi:dihydrofolate synthase/folylpolyglutamate synthase
VLYRNLESELRGGYQYKNITTALAAIRILDEKVPGLNEQSIADGLKNVIKYTGLSGRWQQIGSSPKIICDTGHNQDGLKNVVHQLSLEQFDKLHVVFGTVNDKDLTLILPLLPRNARYYFTKADIARALDEQVLKNEAHKYQLKGESYASVNEALEAATKMANKNDLVFIGGSTFVVAETLQFYM